MMENILPDEYTPMATVFGKTLSIAKSAPEDRA